MRLYYIWAIYSYFFKLHFLLKKLWAEIILYLYIPYIFFFSLLFTLYIWTEIIFVRNCEKENIYGYILYLIIYEKFFIMFNDIFV